MTQDNNNSIKKYDNEIKNYVNKIETLNNNIQKLSLENKKLKKQINEKEIDSLYKIIEDLTEELNRYPFILEKDEKILSVIFMSSKVNYSMICKNTDTMNKLEPELYKECPEFSQTENIFLCKGTIMDKSKKFKELNIKNGDIIAVNQMEDSIIL